MVTSNQTKPETETYNWFLMPCQMWWLHQIKQNLRQPWPAMVSETCSKVWQPHIFGLQWSHNLAVNSDSHTSLVYRSHRIWQSQNLAVNSDSHTSLVYRGHIIWQWTLTATHLWSTEVTEIGSELWQPHIFGLQRSQNLAVNSDSHTSSAYRGHRNWQWTLTAIHLRPTEVTEIGSELWQPHIFGLQRSQKLAVNSDSHTSLVYRGHRNWQWTLTATHLWSTEVTESGSELWQPHIFGLQRSQKLAVNSDGDISSVYRSHRNLQ